LAKVLVFQHVPYEPLGTLDPLIRDRKHRIRYVNFGRDPLARPSIEGYDALIVLGGPMNIGEEGEFPHLETEKELIKAAVAAGMPILGICLGAQLIASALGGEVYQAESSEIGWYQMNATNSGDEDPLIKFFNDTEQVFQWHGFTFELPKEAELLVKGEQVKNQAFRINDNVYGFQFHLEASPPLIKRWLHLPQHQAELGLDKAPSETIRIWQETQTKVERSLELSKRVFGAFLDLLPQVKGKHNLAHRHF